MLQAGICPKSPKKPGYFLSRPQGINYNGNCSNYCYILSRLAEILLLPKFLVFTETVVWCCFALTKAKT